MWPYFAFISIPAALGLSGQRRASLLQQLFILALYVVFMGWRYQVGSDWWGYQILHRRAAAQEYWDLLFKLEPASNILFKLSYDWSGTMVLSNAVAAAILPGGIMTFARRTNEPWLALVSATPYLVIAFGMSGIRQAMAAGILLYVLSNEDKWTIGVQAIWVAIAALFHASGVVGLGFVLIGWRAQPAIKFSLIGVILIVAVYLALNGGDEGVLDTYSGRYVGERSVASIGSLFHISFILIPAAMGWWFRRQVLPAVPFPALLYGGFLATGLVVAMQFVASPRASRLTVYLYFVPMMVYPAFLATMPGKSATSYRALIVIGHVALLAGWLLFANNSAAHIPYRSYLFMDL